MIWDASRLFCGLMNHGIIRSHALLIYQGAMGVQVMWFFFGGFLGFLALGFSLPSATLVVLLCLVAGG